jgi:hypothetical protein
LAESVEQQAIGHDRQLVRTAVNPKLEELFFHEKQFLALSD